MNCTLTGRTIKSMELRIQERVGIIWNTRNTTIKNPSGSPTTDTVGPLNAACGTGNNHWRTWMKGTDNNNDTRTQTGATKKIQC